MINYQQIKEEVIEHIENASLETIRSFYKNNLSENEFKTFDRRLSEEVDKLIDYKKDDIFNKFLEYSEEFYKGNLLDFIKTDNVKVRISIFLYYKTYIDIN